MFSFARSPPPPCPESNRACPWDEALWWRDQAASLPGIPRHACPYTEQRADGQYTKEKKKQRHSLEAAGRELCAPRHARVCIYIYTWKAFTRRKVSSTLRPTGRSFMVICRRIPLPSIMTSNRRKPQHIRKRLVTVCAVRYSVILNWQLQPS